MLSRVAALRSSSLLQCKSISKRRRCTTPYQINESPDSVFVLVDECPNNKCLMIDKKGTKSPYIPPWSTKTHEEFPIFLPISNSCNGRMLIPVENNILLYNPSTKYVAKVLEFDKSDIDGRDDHLTSLGLCYDSSINDYKALFFLRHEHYEYNRIGHFCVQASLKEKKWTKVDFPFCYHSVEQGPLLHNRVHWTAYLSENCLERVITCFNPISNAFEILPSPLHKSGQTIAGLGVMDGCLWMTREIDGVDGIEVLKMKEYGVAESWTTMFVIQDVDINLDWCDEALIPLLITDNGQVLFSKYKRYVGEVFAYDPKTNLCTTLCKTRTWAPQVVSFVKNLASPVGYDWDPIEHEHFGTITDREYPDVSDDEVI